MFGWRARIGCIHPRKGQLHTSMIEMEKVMPEGVYLNDVFLDGPKSQAPEHLLEMFPQLEPAAQEVAKIEVDLIIQVGAPVCLAQGLGGDKKIIDLIEQATGVPATTCVTSMVKGLQRMDVHKVVVVCPYYQEASASMLCTVLKHAGFELVSLVRGDVAWGNIADIPQPQVYRMAKTAFFKVQHADGLLIAGGGAPVYEIVEALEMDIGKPVVAHNFAAAWNALSMAHVRQPIKGYGRLLTMF
jgi:maleate cis-trans isomerase